MAMDNCRGKTIVLLVLSASFLTFWPVEAAAEDYYTLLGVPRDASEREIKKAFRKQAVKYHPDKNPDPDARQQFEKIANAYDTLSNSDKRRQYDMFGAEGPQAQQQGWQQQGAPFDYDAFFGRGSGFKHRPSFNFDDIFKDLFGDDHGTGGFKGFHNTQEDRSNTGNSFFHFDMEKDDDGHDPFLGGFDDFGGFGDFFEGFQEKHFETHTSTSGSSRSRNCRTVTKQQGNTVTTYTECS